MGGTGSMSDASARRRSARLAMRLRVVLSGVNAQSQPFEERTETVEVSKYGAKVHTREDLKIGALLSLVRPDSDRASKFKVAYQAARDPEGLRETGIEFIGVDTFWGIQFPPDRSPWM
jgi:hypothetical protein